MKKLIVTFLSLAIVATAGNVMAYFDLLESQLYYKKSEKVDFVDVIDSRTTPNSGYDGNYYGYLDNDNGLSWSGYYLGTANGNDNKVIANTVRYYLGNTVDVVIDKYEDGEENNSSSLVIDYDDSTKISGTFSVSTTNADDPDAIEFYAVKGATQWALYFLDPAQSSGRWSTEHLINGGENTPAISHFTATLVDGSGGGDPDPTNATPEPTTMLLFGTGLLGLAGWGRRKKHC